MKLIFLFVAILGSCVADDVLEPFSQRILYWYNEVHQERKKPDHGVWYPNEMADNYWHMGKTMPQEYWDGYMNPKYFERVGSSFVLKQGAHATEAFKDAIYHFAVLDCGSVAQLVYYLAVGDLVGPKIFDQYVKNHQKKLYFTPFDEDPKDDLFHTLFYQVELPLYSEKNKRPLEKGQLVYFRNYPLYLTKHPMGVAQGYNAIYVGRDDKGNQNFISFWNSGPKSEEEIIALLEERYHRPRDRWDESYLEAHPEEKKRGEKCLEKYEPFILENQQPFFEDHDLQSYRLRVSEINKIR